MPRQEVKRGNDESPYLYRLIPGQRRHLSLKLLAANGAMSKNALYCQTVPAAIKRGLTRSIGTYGDTSMSNLVKAELVAVEYKYRGKQPPKWSADMTTDEFAEYRNARHRKVSSYTITDQGKRVLNLLNEDRKVEFGGSGMATGIYLPGDY